MKFSDHVNLIPKAIQETYNHNHEFKPLPKNIGKIYAIGSGSSYSQAIYTQQLFKKYLNIPVFYDNPYSFVKNTEINSNDVLIHVTQEAKRNDNICPVEFANKNGAHTILFTSKETELSKKCNEVYWFAPEFEKILVASTSYVSAHMAILKWINSQLKFKELPQISIDIDKIITNTKKALNHKFNVYPEFTTFLYAGWSKSVAIEGALKVNECMLIGSESYELKHYSHGKHFVSYNKIRTYNILCHEKDMELVELYKGTIIEPHHHLNIMISKLPPELAIFEWMSLMLKYIVDGMAMANLELENIPVHDRIRIPHSYKY